MELYFSRLRLRRDPSVEALRQLIDPQDSSRRVDAHHRLLWSVFADGPERKRDFLWRVEKSGLFYVLSHRKPMSNDLFETPDIKTFAPVLSRGDRLRFVLRANAVRSVPCTDGNGLRRRGRKVDVAMHLLKDVPGASSGEGQGGRTRKALRYALATEASQAWMERQGLKHGFSLDEDQFVLDDYSTVTLPGYRGKRESEPRFGIFDMKGVITVEDPESFSRQLGEGFGRAKAFGLGLMLIRRV
ncbi:MAG: type I-E CRISPR-associated protein Cas6/Cse3/CasE [Gammaproteobacteria bacterium]|nr:MAG: type I-E CRISPR-associated protein Cas6/Cse3/CasE [Gammaproteobacteria bacterium]